MSVYSEANGTPNHALQRTAAGRRDCSPRAPGWSYDGNGEYNKAIADYTEAIRLDPKYKQAYTNRGVSYAKKGEYDKAIADFTEAIRLNPTQPMSYMNRANAYRALGGVTKQKLPATNARLKKLSK